jgi:small-conductance mechanosensitive channel
MLGITWKVLLPLIGALGIGAGFGLQSIINNYISGFILIFNRKVEIGDIVEIQGKAGEFVGNNQNIIFGVVTDIGVINTVIETVDGISVAVPNSKFVSDNIINYTLTDNLVRMRIPFKVGYDVKKEKVEEILLKVIQEFERFLVRYPKPQVWFNQIKDYYNEYVLVFWIDARNWKKIMWLKSEVYKRVWEEFEKEDIKVPVINVEITASEKQKSIDIKQ